MEIDERRAVAVCMAMRGQKLASIAESLKVNKSTVCRWLQRFEEKTGKRVLQHSPGRPRAVVTVGGDVLAGM